MIKKLSLCSVGLILLWLVAGGCLAAEKCPKVEPIEPSGIKKLMEGEQGVVVVVLAVWCVPCREELPFLSRIYEKHRDRGVRIVGISVDLDSPSVVLPLLREKKVSFPVFWGGQKAMDEFSISAVPLLLFGRNGAVVERVVGKRSEQFLETKILAFFEQKGGSPCP